MHRTFQVLATELPVPSFVPRVHYQINDYFVFDLNISAIHAAIYILYYFALEPIAAVSYERIWCSIPHGLTQLLYLPQLVLMLLTATAFSKYPGHITRAAILHVVSWIAQFLGHGLAEKRAPALLDNLLGGKLSIKCSLRFN